MISNGSLIGVSMLLSLPLNAFFEWLIYWIPFYFEAKIIFLAWLIFKVNTNFGGAHFVYSCYIEPFLESREKSD
ncbi:hypothetical protein FDP41_003744 [Naegleria fowleri]|uniref:HVA22-like protein n=1 Tax=Naegleria fowleri TaxID=5763 RepID=A0A6A5BS08_NAEFO|nr:uncharacterized protein FDP41_003744 [Naegleria fowleri]KAF0977091.1 hypothetical protein FDP41_003744 [Naegleria fowleri]